MIEALACGRPVVYSNSGGVPELVGSEAGIGVGTEQTWDRDVPPDPVALAEAVAKVSCAAARLCGGGADAGPSNVSTFASGSPGTARSFKGSWPEMNAVVRRLACVAVSHAAVEPSPPRRAGRAPRRRRRQAPPDALRELLTIESDLSGLIDEQALAYDNGVHVKHRLMRYHDFFVDRIAADDRVLDIGCGYGAVAYSIATRSGATVVGLDMDPANVELARQRFQHERLSFVEGEAPRVLPPGPFSRHRDVERARAHRAARRVSDRGAGAGSRRRAG